MPPKFSKKNKVAPSSSTDQINLTNAKNAKTKPRRIQNQVCPLKNFFLILTQNVYFSGFGFGFLTQTQTNFNFEILSFIRLLNLDHLKLHIFFCSQNH
jgi:hypothetical protein